ncbi:MAG TPA: hypothetical protein DEP84_02260, partial [Chloroflexi bacterium]|nr:hypothetical protein [Chloroflexota bacterium]
QVLFRPEQVALSAEAPADGALVLGHGRITEQNFAGAHRRVRLRLPRLPATRQIAPPPPFGEEGLLVDAVLPAEMPLTSHDLWVTLQGWHILKQPHPRLLVCDGGVGPATSLATARQVAERLQASVTILGVADDPEAADALHTALTRRQHAQGLRPAELLVRHGNPAEQIASAEAEAVYELLVLAASDDPEAHPERLGATVRAVLEQTAMPVMVVKGEGTGFQRLLICTAAGEPGKGDVRFGGRLARRLGASVTLLYVTTTGEELSPLARAHLERASVTLRALELASEVWVRPSMTAAEGILAVARDGDYDLIVMGSHGPQSRSIFGLDDVTLQVLAGADRPVLVVPDETV